MRRRLSWGSVRRAKSDAIAAECDDIVLVHGGSILKLDAARDGVPDRVIGYHGLNDVWEYKDPKKGRLRPAQEELIENWRGAPIRIVRGRDDALEALAYMRERARKGSL